MGLMTFDLARQYEVVNPHTTFT